MIFLYFLSHSRAMGKVGTKLSQDDLSLLERIGTNIPTKISETLGLEGKHGYPPSIYLD